jgi:hypothetical protein
MSASKYDVFISHASEDKDELVRTLAEELQSYGATVWYDEFSLEIGDSLTKKINEGLANSSYGVVVLSKSFLNKGWPEYELDGLLNREIGNSKIILPIWHQVTRAELLAYSPTLAGKVALDTSKIPMREMVLKILKVIRPDIFNNMLRIQAYKNLIKRSHIEVMEASKLKPGPIRHETLSNGLINRIQLIHSVFADVSNVSLEKTINNFQRDMNPEKEIGIWERMAGAYMTFNRQRNFTTTQKEEVLAILLKLSLGTGAEKQHILKELSSQDVDDLFNLYSNLPGIPKNSPEWDDEL